MWSCVLHGTDFAGLEPQNSIMRRCLFGFLTNAVQSGAKPAWRFSEPRITGFPSRFAKVGRPMTNRSHCSGPIDAAMAIVLAFVLAAVLAVVTSLALIQGAAAAPADAGSPTAVLAPVSAQTPPFCGLVRDGPRVGAAPEDGRRLRSAALPTQPRRDAAAAAHNGGVSAAGTCQR